MSILAKNPEFRSCFFSFGKEICFLFLWMSTSSLLEHGNFLIPTEVSLSIARWAWVKLKACCNSAKLGLLHYLGSFIAPLLYSLYLIHYGDVCITNFFFVKMLKIWNVFKTWWYMSRCFLWVCVCARYSSCLQVAILLLVQKIIG